MDNVPDDILAQFEAQIVSALAVKQKEIRRESSRKGYLTAVQRGTYKLPPPRPRKNTVTNSTIAPLSSSETIFSLLDQLINFKGI